MHRDKWRRGLTLATSGAWPRHWTHPDGRRLRDERPRGLTFATAAAWPLGRTDPYGRRNRVRAAPRADFGVPIPVWELGLPQDANLDQLVDALYTRRRHWVATNLGDVRLYSSRVMGKLAQHLLDEREGVGRPGRMSVAHALAGLRHQAVPSPEMLQLGARALLGIVRFIVLALESAELAGSPAARGGLPQARHGVPAGAPAAARGPSALTVSRRLRPPDDLARPRRPASRRPALVAARRRGSQNGA